MRLSLTILAVSVCLNGCAAYRYTHMERGTPPGYYETEHNGGWLIGYQQYRKISPEALCRLAMRRVEEWHAEHSHLNIIIDEANYSWQEELRPHPEQRINLGGPILTGSGGMTHLPGRVEVLKLHDCHYPVTVESH